MTDRSPSFFGFPRRPGPRPHGIDPHQPFDPVQSAGKSLLENIAPDATGPIGPVTGLEARFDRSDEPGVVDRTSAGRRVSQAWKPERETSRTSQSQLIGQMWLCLAMKANLISSPARKKPQHRSGPENHLRQCQVHHELTPPF